MANEVGSIGEGIDIGGSPREDLNKVTEEAVRRVQDQSKKAQQAHKQIQQDKQINNNLAKFLTFLLSDIKEDSIIKVLHELFFKTKHPSTGTTYIRKNINTMVIVGFFFPFYLSEAKKLSISGLFEPLLGNEPVNLTGYIDYIKRLSAQYHDNIPLNSDLLIDFIVSLIGYFNIYDIKSLDSEKQKEFILKIKNELYK